MPDTNENIDEQTKPAEPAEPAKPTKVAGAKKPASTVGLPVFIACVAAAAIVGVAVSTVGGSLAREQYCWSC